MEYYEYEDIYFEGASQKIKPNLNIYIFFFEQRRHYRVLR